jgi:transcriptional regulator with XRE-family HTH domain
VQHFSPLVRELLRLANERNWSRAELAARLDVHPTLLAHVQAGRRRISVDMLSRILRAFGEVQAVRDFVLNYLLVEVPELEAAEGRLALVGTDDARATRLPPTADNAIRSYLGTFLRSFYEGKGLFLTSTDTRLLRETSRALLAACEQRHIAALATDASVKLSATFTRAALQKSLLVVERVDFASPSVVELLLRRADLLKPSVLTAGGGIGSVRDPHLARVARSMMHIVDLAPAPSLPDAIHA